MAEIKELTTRAGTTEDSRTLTVKYNRPENLAEATEMYGEEVVFSNAMASIVITMQGMIRRHLKGTEKSPAKSDEEIQALVDAYKPGVSTRQPKDPTANILKSFEGMDAEKRKDVIAQLKALLKADAEGGDTAPKAAK